MVSIYDKLERDIIFFDLETTGVDIKKDKIVEICAIKYRTDKTKLTYQKYYNPGIEIHPSAVGVHGLTNEFLSQFKTFEESCDELFDFFKDCDLGGYNCVNFDIPILFEEFSRSNKKPKWFNINIIDSYNLLNKFETRKLNDVYKRFFGKDIENTHSATDDIEATIKVFEKQLELYNIEDKSLKEISNIIRSDQNGYKIIDLSSWFKLKDGEYLFNKGKHKDYPVKDHKSYLQWLVGNPNIENNSRLVGKLIGEKLNILT